MIAGLREEDRDDVLVLVGGIIPEGDIPILKDQGVAEVFTPGAPLPAIGKWLEEALDAREARLDPDEPRTESTAQAPIAQHSTRAAHTHSQQLSQ